jgi:hypothetical protein
VPLKDVSVEPGEDDVLWRSKEERRFSTPLGVTVS